MVYYSLRMLLVAPIIPVILIKLLEGFVSALFVSQDFVVDSGSKTSRKLVSDGAAGARFPLCFFLLNLEVACKYIESYQL